MPTGPTDAVPAVLPGRGVSAAAAAGEARGPVRPRPAWLRALGHDDPPPDIVVAGRAYRREVVFKHDAFAATALYVAVDDTSQRVVGKFSRRQHAFGVPMGWLGRWFHAREQRVVRLMADVPTVPATVGGVEVDGRPMACATARRYVEGQPLREHQRVGDGFFPELSALLEEFHRRRIAVVDLHKRENILVDPEGRPHLMDFQISLAAGPVGSALGSVPLRCLDPRSWLLGPAQRADRYHLMKHWIRHRPDQLADADRDLDRYRPRGVRLWRRGIRPVHRGRRWLFVRLKFRTGRGEAETEVGPEVRSE